MNTVQQLLSFAAVTVAAVAPAAAQQLISRCQGTVAGTGFGTAMAAIDDLDGDGVRDLVVGLPTLSANPLQPGSGAVRVYGSRSGQLLRQTAGTTAAEGLGRVVAGLGDCDGDGVPDYATGNPQWNANQGRVTLCSGQDGRVLFSWTGENLSEFGTAIAAVGDVNGDGRADFAASAPKNSNVRAHGLVRCFGFGHLTALRQIAGTNNSLFGTSLATMGDTNGNGFLELAIGEPQSPVNGSFSGRVHLRDAALSGPQGLIWNTVNAFPQYGRGGAKVAWAGDCNRDGTPDILAAESRGVFVLSGRDGAVLRLVVSDDAGFGSSFAGIGDFNGDGIDDFAVGSPLHNNLAGRVTIHNGANGQVLLTLDGALGEQFGAEVIAIGDVNGDGRSDVAIGVPGFRAGNAAVGCVSIYGWREVATVRSIGSGCPGAAGVPALSTNDMPILGQTVMVRCGNLQSHSLGMWIFGFSDLSHGNLNLPLSLAPFGMPACSLWVSIDASLSFLTGNSNSARFTFPSIGPVFIGKDLFLQTAMLDPQAPGGFSFSNGLGLHFGTE